jgi:hypothetical protein
MWRCGKVLLASLLVFVASIATSCVADEWRRRTYGHFYRDELPPGLRPDDLAAIALTFQLSNGLFLVAFGAFVVCVASLGAVLGRTHGWYRRYRRRPAVEVRGFEVIR